MDLAHQIACLLYEIDRYAQALSYFERSMEIYGQDTGTLYNMAVCYQCLEQHEPAETILKKLLKYDPDNQAARELLAKYTAGQIPSLICPKSNM
ncbi:MAG: tetratricopeptide repeat protein [Gammaproteobacteria bacterium]|nr:tetratricopeptide repeat protein [Gammaproteobacteria bacterium]